MKKWSVKSIIIITIIFVLFFLFFIFTSQSYRDDLLYSSSMGWFLYFVTVPGFLVDLFLAPNYCRDHVSSMPSFFNCPYLIYVELLYSYIFYIALALFIFRRYNNVKK